MNANKIYNTVRPVEIFFVFLLLIKRTKNQINKAIYIITETIKTDNHTIS